MLDQVQLESQMRIVAFVTKQRFIMRGWNARLNITWRQCNASPTPFLMYLHTCIHPRVTCELSRSTSTASSVREFGTRRNFRNESVPFPHYYLLITLHTRSRNYQYTRISLCSIILARFLTYPLRKDFF